MEREARKEKGGWRQGGRGEGDKEGEGLGDKEGEGEGDKGERRR